MLRAEQIQQIIGTPTTTNANTTAIPQSDMDEEALLSPSLSLMKSPSINNNNNSNINRTNSSNNNSPSIIGNTLVYEMPATPSLAPK